MADQKSDTVNHPGHYNTGRIEVIDAIEDWKLGFNLGNCVKYVARADHKGNREEDLRKAKWYLDRELAGIRPPQADGCSPSQADVVAARSPTVDEWIGVLPKSVTDTAEVIGVQFTEDGRDGDVLIVKNTHGAIGELITRTVWSKRYSDSDVRAVIVRRDRLPEIPRKQAPAWLKHLRTSERDIREDLGADDAVLGTIEDKVCHMLNGKSDDAFTVAQIAEETGVDQKSLCSCLSRLLRRGVIAKPARGVYCSRRRGRVGSSRG